MMAVGPDGTRLHYTVTGGGPPLVLVGGKTSTIASAWWRHIPELAREFRVIAFDNRGAGESDRPDVPYTTALMARDAESVLRAAGERSAHWFGLSLGGMVLQELAIASPALVRSLVLGATACRGVQSVTPPAPEDAAALAGSPYRRLAHLYRPAFILKHPEHMAEDTARFGRMPLHAILRQDQAVRSHDACGRLGQIQVPVLIIHGRQDRMVPVERADELRRALPRAELLVLDGGHQVHSEQAAAVIEAVSRFIRQVEAPG